MIFDAVIIIGLPEANRGVPGGVETLNVPIYYSRGFNAKRLHLRADERTASQSPGQVGCYLAHAAALRLIEHLPHHWFLVLEDDTEVSGQFWAAMQTFHLPADAEFIAFRGGRDELHAWRATSFAYGVTKAGARKLVERLESRGGHIDWMLAQAVREGVVNAWFLSDAFVRHTPGVSFTSPIPRSGNYSQHGEQQIIQDWIQANMPGVAGRFLEIGAADGVTFSNCRALAEAGWSGLCVEPNPYLWCELNRIYKDNTEVQTLCALVWPWPEIRTLHLNQDGLSTSDAQVYSGMQRRGVYFHGACASPTVTPQQLSASGPFDVISIDAEGADLLIVQHGKELFSGAKLLCVEKCSPVHVDGVAVAARDVMRQACAEHGFGVVVAETEGNFILSK